MAAEQTIPRHLLRQSPAPRFLLSDELELTILAGETSVTLNRDDLARLARFVNKFEREEAQNAAN